VTLFVGHSAGKSHNSRYRGRPAVKFDPNPKPGSPTTAKAIQYQWDAQDCPSLVFVTGFKYRCLNFSQRMRAIAK
jgi:hypothetical protein